MLKNLNEVGFWISSKDVRKNKLLRTCIFDKFVVLPNRRGFSVARGFYYLKGGSTLTHNDDGNRFLIRHLDL